MISNFGENIKKYYSPFITEVQKSKKDNRKTENQK